jgi:hypothetical protein
MARIEDIDRRLQNWGRWKHGAGAGGLGYARVRSMMRVDGGEQAGPIVPTNDCEAQDTDGAVMALPSELRATIEVYYVQGGGMADKAKRLACTEPTIRNRIARAHPLIQSFLADLAARRQQQRMVNESAQQRARPKGDLSEATFVEQMKAAQERRRG